MSDSLPIAITMGEPAGVGIDLIIELFLRRFELNLPEFIVYGNISIFKQRAKLLGKSLNLKQCPPEQVKSYFSHSLPLVNIGNNLSDSPKIFNEQNSKAAILAIERAVSDIHAKKCCALVSAPIHKSALYNLGFEFAGHTEFLAHLCKKNEQTPTPVMMLAHENLRVIPLTIHEPISQVPLLLTKELIETKAKIVVESLKKYFNIQNPKLAICGLNPHAGEDGTIGTEDKDIIAPIVEKLNRQGTNIVGPLPADTLFYPPHWQQYDAILACYHDQALIPIKTLAFDRGVNITLGLPIIRTSPDHGSALDLAGTGKASISSVLAAIKMAHKMSGAQN